MTNCAAFTHCFMLKYERTFLLLVTFEALLVLTFQFTCELRLNTFAVSIVTVTASHAAFYYRVMMLQSACVEPSVAFRDLSGSELLPLDRRKPG